jgi:RNA polymerase sigma-70 factor (ECF subfamily)
VDPALRRLGLSVPECDEVKQLTRVKLLVAKTDGELPRIALYSGRGALKGWLRAVAIRIALNEYRKTGNQTQLFETDWACWDDEHTVRELRVKYGHVFKRAFQDAIAELSPRDRTLLRQRLLDALPVADLAAMHGVHRVSISRRIKWIREHLLTRTRELLSLEPGLAATALDSIIRAVRSSLDLSIQRCLAEGSGGDERA